MSAKHTPGPWGDDCPLCGGKGEVSISVDGTHEGTDYYGCPMCISRERDEDIKRLRALNADLLEALKAMCQEFRALDLPYGSEAYTQATSAINKATAGMPHQSKCSVDGCENHAEHGPFCKPCYHFVIGDGGLHSQAYRNIRRAIDAAVAMEREAMLDLVDDYAKDNTDIKDAIRARGQK